MLLVFYLYVFFCYQSWCPEKAMATHSSTLPWKIPWTEEPGSLQSMGSLRVGHDWATSLSWIGEGSGNPLQCSRLENPRDGGVWWAAVSGVAQSRTRLKRLSSSSSSRVDVIPHTVLLISCFLLSVSSFKTIHLKCDLKNNCIIIIHIDYAIIYSGNPVLLDI